jgi:hypothetical protein
MDFEIVVQGYSTSVDEWARAKRAQPNELPALTHEQKAFARKFGVSTEDYARSVLAGRFGSERLNAEAVRFARLLQELVSDLKNGGDVQVTMLVYAAFDREFTWHMREGSKEFSCHLGSVQVADHLDSGDPKLRERLKQLLIEKIEEARAQAVGAGR